MRQFIIFVLFIFSTISASFADVMPDNINYKINEKGTVSIIKSPDASGDIVIPEQINIDGKLYDVT